MLFTNKRSKHVQYGRIITIMYRRNMTFRPPL